MAKNHVAPGKVIQYTNATGLAIASSDCLIVGEIFGVALVDIANGATGSVAIDEVFDCPKTDREAIGQGLKVYWDGTYITLDDYGNTYAGVSYEAAAEAATSIPVILNK